MVTEHCDNVKISLAPAINYGPAQITPDPTSCVFPFNLIPFFNSRFRAYTLNYLKVKLSDRNLTFVSR